MKIDSFVYSIITLRVPTMASAQLINCMSGKTKQDYRCVFRKLLELLPSPAVKQVTLDFEKTPRQLLKACSLLVGPRGV